MLKKRAVISLLKFPPPHFLFFAFTSCFSVNYDLKEKINVISSSSFVSLSPVLFILYDASPLINTWHSRAIYCIASVELIKKCRNTANEIIDDAVIGYGHASLCICTILCTLTWILFLNLNITSTVITSKEYRCIY